jgi:hypothetical protein
MNTSPGLHYCVIKRSVGLTHEVLNTTPDLKTLNYSPFQSFDFSGPDGESDITHGVIN